MNETWSYNWDRLGEPFEDTDDDLFVPEDVWLSDVDETPDEVFFGLFDDLPEDPIELEF